MLGVGAVVVQDGLCWGGGAVVVQDGLCWGGGCSGLRLGGVRGGL